MIKTVRQKALWTATNPVPAAYPWLTEDIMVDVAVVGGGLTGALCALRLQEEGLQTAIISSIPIGYGGTAVSSGAAQYEMPGGISGLAEKVGIDKAVRAFALCRDGMEQLEEMVQKLKCDCGCRRSDSFLFAAQRGEEDRLKQEYLLRRHNGFDVEYLNGERAKALFSFEVTAGIISKRMSVSLDPYRFTHAVVAYAVTKGVRVFENTSVREVDCAMDSQVLVTGTGKEVRCGRLVLAVGTEAKEILPAIHTTRTSFGVATDPMEDFKGWPGKCVISNLKGTLNFSVTPDNRIVVMGLDSGMTGVGGRFSGLISEGAFSEKKYNQLAQELSRMFPGMRGAELALAFTSEYAVTPNGLPTIGMYRDYPGCIFAVCGGIAGLSFAPVAARHVAELALEKENSDHKVFSAR